MRRCNFTPKRRCTRPGQFVGFEVWLRRYLFFKILKDFIGHFVGGFGTALVWQKPFEALLLKLTLGFVDRRARQAKVSGGLGNRIMFDLQCAQSLVFDLEQILGIKKVRLLKELVSHLRGAWIKGTAGLQGLAFGFGIRWHMCKYNYATQSYTRRGCQGQYIATFIAVFLAITPITATGAVPMLRNSGVFCLTHTA